MFKTSLAAVACAAVFLQGCASAPPGAPLAAELERQGAAWDEAIVRKDRAAIAANMADDFLQIRDNGQVGNKEQFLAAIMAPELVIEPYKVEDFSVRQYGDVALVGGTTKMKGSYAGHAFSSHYRYIDVYVRSGGKWKISSVQITPILGK
jgi:ketosteroid isomerase-like protein